MTDIEYTKYVEREKILAARLNHKDDNWDWPLWDILSPNERRWGIKPKQYD